MKAHLVALLLLTHSVAFAQNDLPYREIPEYPSSYTAGTVTARVLDGLGFRYYWATEGLRKEDLEFQPNKDGRTSLETITHIFELSLTIINAARNVPNDNTLPKPVLTFDEMRRRTLTNIQEASEILKKASDAEVSQLKVIFKSDKGTSEFPFWNELNGPIADALWHTGQVVSFRRGSGNPFNAKVSVFAGKVRP
ncbi:MAG: hypothetical protein JNN04_07785 [Cyclobacteriaceae bacterium]|nr:hypothetical protein [Cyclobacteriaceae bacterium]